LNDEIEQTTIIIVIIIITFLFVNASHIFKITVFQNNSVIYYLGMIMKEKKCSVSLINTEARHVWWTMAGWLDGWLSEDVGRKGGWVVCLDGQYRETDSHARTHAHTHARTHAATQPRSHAATQADQLSLGVVSQPALLSCTPLKMHEK
jgi:hypothetical protein